MVSDEYIFDSFPAN